MPEWSINTLVALAVSTLVVLAMRWAERRVDWITSGTPTEMSLRKEIEQLKQQISQIVTDYETELAKLNGWVRYLMDLLMEERRQAGKEPINFAAPDELERVPDLRVLGIWPDDGSLAQRAEADALYNSGIGYRALIGNDVTKNRIVSELLRNSYNGLQVGGHGERTQQNGRALKGGIWLSDGLTPPGWWGRLCRRFPEIDFVVLMACESEEVGDAMTREGVPTVISISGEIEDGAALSFVRSLYTLLGDSHGVRDGVELARLGLAPNQAEMIHLHERETMAT